MAPGHQSPTSSSRACLVLVAVLVGPLLTLAVVTPEPSQSQFRVRLSSDHGESMASLPFEMTLRDRDIFLSKPGHKHAPGDRAVPAFVVTKIEADHVPTSPLSSLFSSTRPTSKPDNNDPTIPVLLTVRTETATQEPPRAAASEVSERKFRAHERHEPIGGRQVTKDEHDSELKPSSPRNRISNYKRVTSRVVQRDIPLTYESLLTPALSQAVHFPASSERTADPPLSDFMSKPQAIIRQYKNITLHYHVTNYHPDHKGKESASHSSENEQSVATEPSVQAVHTSNENSGVDSQLIPSYVPIPMPSESSPNIMQRPYHDEQRVPFHDEQRVPFLMATRQEQPRRRQGGPNTSFTRAMAARHLAHYGGRRQFADHMRAASSEQFRQRHRYVNRLNPDNHRRPRHMAFVDRNYNMYSAGSDREVAVAPVPSEEPTKLEPVPAESDKVTHYTSSTGMYRETTVSEAAFETTTPAPAASEIVTESVTPMYEHQDYQAFPYQPVPNSKKYVPPPASPDPAPMTEYMRPQIAYRPTSEQYQQAGYETFPIPPVIHEDRYETQTPPPPPPPPPRDTETVDHQPDSYLHQQLSAVPPQRYERPLQVNYQPLTRAPPASLDHRPEAPRTYPRPLGPIDRPLRPLASYPRPTNDDRTFFGYLPIVHLPKLMPRSPMRQPALYPSVAASHNVFRSQSPHQGPRHERPPPAREARYPLPPFVPNHRFQEPTVPIITIGLKQQSSNYDG